MVKKFDNINEFSNWLEMFCQENIMYIAGAGKYGKIIGKFLTDRGIPWKGFVDKKDDLFEVDGKKVYSYSNIINENGYFIVASQLYADNIIIELQQRNISIENIIVISNIQDIVYSIYDLSVEWSRYTRKLNIFSKKYEGKRCFIIGTGPSLRIADLEKLDQEITFSCNSIYALYENTKWRPTFYCANDPVFCKAILSDKKNIQMLTYASRAVFTSIIGEGFQYRDDNSIDNLYYIITKKGVNKETGLPLFSEECSTLVYESGTISYIMLQLAVYMGFHTIYLLGMDFSYTIERHKDGKIEFNDRENHMYKIQKEENIFGEENKKKHGYSYVADIDWQKEGYQAARKYADEHGIRIYNVTRGGKLEVFERVDFDTLF